MSPVILLSIYGLILLMVPAIFILFIGVKMNIKRHK